MMSSSVTKRYGMSSSDRTGGTMQDNGSKLYSSSRYASSLLTISSHNSMASWDDIEKEMKRYTASKEMKKYTTTESNQNATFQSKKKDTTTSTIPMLLDCGSLLDSSVQPLMRDESSKISTIYLPKLKQQVQKDTTPQEQPETTAAPKVEKQKTATAAPMVAPTNPSPSQLLQFMLQGISMEPFEMDSIWNKYFAIESTKPTVVVESFPAKLQKKVLRHDNLEKLKTIVEQGLVDLKSSTATGETMLALACREGATTIVEYLIKEVGVPVKVRDQTGKTPLHEVCWHTHPPNFEIVSLLLCQAPELILARDDRHFTALDYIPLKCRNEWCLYLERKASYLRIMLELSACRWSLVLVRESQFQYCLQDESMKHSSRQNCADF